MRSSFKCFTFIFHAIHPWWKSWRAETVESTMTNVTRSLWKKKKKDILSMSLIHRLSDKVSHEVSRAVPQCTTSRKWWAASDSFKPESKKFHIHNQQLKSQLPRSLKIHFVVFLRVLIFILILRLSHTQSQDWNFEYLIIWAWPLLNFHLLLYILCFWLGIKYSLLRTHWLLWGMLSHYMV